MFILWWIIFGGIVGWLATIISGDNARYGILANIAIGVVGAMIGSLIAGLFGFDGVTGFNLGSIVVAILGATALVYALGAMRKGSHTR